MSKTTTGQPGETRFRAGANQLEIAVRHSGGREEWSPLDMRYGRQVLVDCYHPDVPEMSASGGKCSRKAKS